MVSSYDEMQGDAMDTEAHPSHNVPQATQHYAGDVIAFPQSLGTMASSIIGGTMNNIAQSSRTAMDRTNVTPIKKPK